MFSHYKEHFTDCISNLWIFSSVTMVSQGLHRTQSVAEPVGMNLGPNSPDVPDGLQLWTIWEIVLGVF